jgi:ABC-type multidrug transport system ATPase subunit
MSDSENVIEVKNLAKRFGTFEAVRDVSFTVHKGDVFGFLGPNGAGKSTTIRCMLSLIRPDSGSIRLFGMPLAENRSAILRRVGCIIEKPDFYKYLSAEKNLEMFSRISGNPSRKKDIYGMLDFVGLNGRERDKVAGFSHGMKQRLGIAQTLLHNPDLIVLDEPTTGLDPQGIIDIRNLILRLKTEQNKTVILSSHQLSEIEIIANRLVIINKGKSLIEGEVAQLLNAEELIVRLEVDSIANAQEVLTSSFPRVSVLHTEESALEISIDREQVPLLNAAFVQRGIQVYSLESRKKLEDYFIKTVQQA